MNGFEKALVLLVVLISKISTRAFSPLRSAVRPSSIRPQYTKVVLQGSDQSMSDDDVPPPQHVLIAGAGIVGVSTAYYLQKNFGSLIQSITLIDPTGTIAPAASGKAAGFLALDMNDGTPTDTLTHRSFNLHQELANDLGASNIQYRRVTCAAIGVNPNSSSSGVTRPRGKKFQHIEWAQPTENSAVVAIQPLGEQDTIAQVHPKKLCEQMWHKICQTVPNAKIIQGIVKGAVHGQESGMLVGAKLSDDTIIQGDALLFSCGPWTSDFMRGVKYNSVIVPSETVLTQCVFFSGCGDPEVYVRPDSTAYCTGFPDNERKVTERPGEETVQNDKIATIVESVRQACGHNHNTEAAAAVNKDNSNRLAFDLSNPIVKQACYLPVTPDGIPVMGLLPKEICGGKRCYIAAGHGCWGILLGPASGESMASLIMSGTSAPPQVDLGPFEPTRFASFALVP